MKLIFLTLLAVLILNFPYTVSAQTPTLTPSGSIRDSVKQQVDEELSQIKKAVAKKGFAGTVSAKSDGTLTISNLKNEPRSATVTADVTIKLASGKDGTPADLKVGDFVLAMGDVDGANLMTVKRLLVIAKPAVDNRKTLFGSVTNTTSSSLTLETADKKSHTVRLQSATKYTKTTKAADVKVDSKVMVIGTSTNETTTTAKIIHLFAQ